MRKYSVDLSKYISPDTKTPVYDLYVNDRCLFDKFYNQVKIESNLMRYLAAAIKIIESAANGYILPEQKLRRLKHKNLPYKLYEAKKEDIRIYFFYEEQAKKIIITGGKNLHKRRIFKL